MWRALYKFAGITFGSFVDVPRNWGARSIETWEKPAGNGRDKPFLVETYEIDVPPGATVVNIRSPEKTVPGRGLCGAAWFDINQVLEKNVALLPGQQILGEHGRATLEHHWSKNAASRGFAKNSTAARTCNESEEDAAAEATREELEDLGPAAFKIMAQRRASEQKNAQRCQINGKYVGFTPDSGATSSCLTYGALEELGPRENFKIQKLEEPYEILLADSSAGEIREHIVDATITITAWSGAKQKLWPPE